MKVAFLDRDGTLIPDHPDAEWPTIQRPVLFGDTAEALALLRQKGYALILITNQYLIGEGFITQADYEAFTRHLVEALCGHGIELLDILHCPHARSEGCECCKPRPGLVHEALRRYPAIEMGGSFFAGDSPADRDLAASLGLPFYLVDYESRPPKTLLAAARSR